ncbi:MAG: DUF366 family protein [Planctomycetes bacterium]|nr:DUF366 family protein [Planctomycetota bacterium]
MLSAWLEETLAYDGSQLRAHWILRHCGLVGDAVVAFRGPCRVADREMADLEDLLSGVGIAGDDMVHFLCECFDDGDLLRAVYVQRLFSAAAGDTLRALAPGVDLRRQGDDLFVGPGKLSISIATRSPVSTLIHFAVNVSNEGTPVHTAALADLGVDPAEFAQRLLGDWTAEVESVRLARAKVRAKDEA